MKWKDTENRDFHQIRITWSRSILQEMIFIHTPCSQRKSSRESKLFFIDRSIVENHRLVVSSIQKSPFYVELQEGNMQFERYSDKYSTQKNNTKLGSFYSYDILSKYIPTGMSAETLAF